MNDQERRSRGGALTTSNPTFDAELLCVALEESAEGVALLMRSLDATACGGAPAKDALLAAHRAVHTLRGVGNAIGGPVTPLAIVCTPAEELLVALRKRDETPKAEVLACLRECSLWLDEMIARLRAGEPAGALPAAALETLHGHLERIQARRSP